MCFNVQDLSTGQTSVGFDIVVGTYNNILSLLANVCRLRRQNELVRMNVREMSSAGLGRLRYVGAWAISRVLKKARKYARDHLCTENEKTRDKVEQNLKKVELLEEFIKVS